MGVNPLALLEGTMAFEGVNVPSFWGYNEYNETVEELNQRLLDTTWELQTLQINAREDMKKKEEHIQRLIHVLKVTSQERDEAREQLQLLMNQVIMPLPRTPQLIWQSKGNSSGTESDSISDTLNHQSHVSSPVESFFEADTMSDSSHIGVPQKLLCNNKNPASFSNYDQVSARFEQLLSKRPLPEKGKLMDAVMQAGPLLQNLLVAGPLPRWKNPPPLQQVQIPPVSVNGGNSQTPNQTAALSLNPLVQSSVNVLHKETPLMHGVSMKRTMISPSVSSFPCSSGKKQKSQ